MKPIHFAQIAAPLLCGFIFGFANAQTTPTPDQTPPKSEVTNQKAELLKDCKARAKKLQLNSDDEQQFVILCVQTPTTSDEATSKPAKKTPPFELMSLKTTALKDCKAQAKKMKRKGEAEEQLVNLCMENASDAANKMKVMRLESVRQNCEQQADRRRLEKESYERINFVNNCVETAEESYKHRREALDKENMKNGDKDDITFTGVAGNVKLECTTSEGLTQASCDALAISVKRLNDIATYCLAAGKQKDLKQHVPFNLYVNSCAEAAMVKELAKIKVIACNAAADLQGLVEDNSMTSRSAFVRHCSQPKKKEFASVESDK